MSNGNKVCNVFQSTKARAERTHQKYDLCLFALSSYECIYVICSSGWRIFIAIVCYFLFFMQTQSISIRMGHTRTIEMKKTARAIRVQESTNIRNFRLLLFWVQISASLGAMVQWSAYNFHVIEQIDCNVLWITSFANIFFPDTNHIYLRFHFSLTLVWDNNW